MIFSLGCMWSIFQIWMSVFTPLSTWAAAQILFVSISLAPFSAPVKKDIWEMDGLAKVSSGSTLPCAYFERLVYEPLYGHTYQIIKPMTVWFKCIGSTVTHFSTVIKNHNWSNSSTERHSLGFGSGSRK